MAKTCTYVRVSGVRCGMIAMNGEDLCYYHLRDDENRHIAERNMELQARMPKLRHIAQIEVPLLEDAATIQNVITEVIRALAQRTISRHEAALMLYGLQTASSNLRSIQQPKAEEVITEVPEKLGSTVQRERMLRILDEYYERHPEAIPESEEKIAAPAAWPAPLSQKEAPKPKIPPKLDWGTAAVAAAAP